MASIERTAYPRFTARSIKTHELKKFYSLTPEEHAYVLHSIRGDALCLHFAVQLKVFQHFHYFPDLPSIPSDIINHVKECLGLPNTFSSSLGYEHTSTLYRHRARIRHYTQVARWGKLRKPVPGKQIHPAQHYAVTLAYEAAKTMNNVADIINVVIEGLIHKRYELPTFYRLNRLVKHTRALVNRRIFATCTDAMPLYLKEKFDTVTLTRSRSARTDYNAIKRLPKRPTLTHFKELLSHHEWLLSLGDMGPYILSISKIKLRQFAAEAKSLDASDLKQIASPKRYTLIACLIYQAQRRAKDALAVTFCKTLSKIHKRGNRKLEELRGQGLQKTHRLLEVLSDILSDCKEEKVEKKLAKKIMKKVTGYGGVEALHNECMIVAALNSNNYFPLMWEFFSPKRSVLFKLLRKLHLHSILNNDTLLKAVQRMLAYSHIKSEHLLISIDLSFASRQWQDLVFKQDGDKTGVVRKYFEMCLFSYLADELHSGDIFIEEAESFANYRDELVEETVCDPLIEDYCRQLNLPTDAVNFVAELKSSFIKEAHTVDQLYPAISEFIIDEKGNPILKRRGIKKHIPNSSWLGKEIRRRMPERNILDILCNGHHHTGWAHELGPLSGSDPKISDPIERYILTSFAYGSCMGPTQAARHMKNDITAHMLSWINRRHVGLPHLNNAITKLINFSNLFPLISAWGDGHACAADGTLRHVREENLIAEFHARYGKRGGIAYHHIANNYIALFSTFIPCGVWEAVEIIEALIKNKSDIKPTTVHADTQGQSTVVFALAHLLGIDLMPRIRNWKDLKLFRPTKNSKYKYINKLFSDSTINWKLIEKTWKEMMRVVVSIKEGKITSSLLLRKLTHYSKKDLLYRGFQELGRVIRTRFLLKYVADIGLRETITAETNKVESYHNLSEWLSFGAMELVASNEEEEMEKAIKYNDILTNSVILQNIIDMSDVIYQLIQEGKVITREDMACLSPYLVEHIKRFGEYWIDLTKIPVSISNSINRALW